MSSDRSSHAKLRSKNVSTSVPGIPRHCWRSSRSGLIGGKGGRIQVRGSSYGRRMHIECNGEPPSDITGQEMLCAARWNPSSYFQASKHCDTSSDDKPQGKGCKAFARGLARGLSLMNAISTRGAVEEPLDARGLFLSVQ